MNTLILPKPLRKGDTVALIAPASSAPHEALQKAIKSIEFFDLVPKLYPSCISKQGYLAGCDSVRASDLNNAFCDPAVQGIFCLRGGYGTMRLLNLLDYDRIRKNPKIFCGYSDITALHTVLNQKCGFVTFHGPMPSIGYHEIDEFSLTSLSLSLFGGINTVSLKNPRGMTLRAVCRGAACGLLAGGNLSLLQSTLGSPYALQPEGKIIFLEEVNEPLYKIDRMLTSLILSGAFNGATGILLGSFSEIASSDRLHALFQDIFQPLGIPVVSGLAAGHEFPQLTLPLGSMIFMDALNPSSVRLTAMPPS